MAMAKKQLAKLVRSKENIARIPLPKLDGSITHYKDFPSKLIRPRPVDVWLPEINRGNPDEQYPVIYMHDGQMMFHHVDSSLAGMDVFWDVDKVITKLLNSKEIRPAIVVAVWMADWMKGSRRAEYMPQKAVTEKNWQRIRKETAVAPLQKEEGDEVISSDNYLKFLVSELKPFIDKTYPTLTGNSDTFIVGSSMGALISAYAIAEYPHVFGGAACMSTDWSIGEGIVAQWFEDHWPAAGMNRIYFDYGTETMDAYYEPYQLRMDGVLRKFGFTKGKDWDTQRFEGADHSPKSWNERLHIPMKFLLGDSSSTTST